MPNMENFYRLAAARIEDFIAITRHDFYADVRIVRPLRRLRMFFEEMQGKIDVPEHISRTGRASLIEIIVDFFRDRSAPAG